MLVDLSGKVVVVPGGSGGVGAAVAEVLAECGADVAIGYHSNAVRAEEVAGAARRHGRRARADRVDAADRQASARWVQDIIAEFGRVDVLASCVGWRGSFQPFLEQKPETWQAILDGQFWGSVNCAHAVLPHMVERGSGRLIALVSDAGKVGASGVALAAGGSAGVIAVFKALARELARFGITANTIGIGPTEGPVLDAIRGEEFGQKIVDAMVRAVPLKRLASAREIGNMFAFVASDAASFVTGQCLSVSGGLTMA
ncbi:MAG: SDR family oxidoreductase [Chloroflexi bacterium]|nr:SDR family oxidoreductase [Chloroflexota bacterium]